MKIGNRLRSASICITGGAGFIGSNLAEAVSDDTDVLIYDDFSTGRRANVPDSASSIKGDVRNTDTLAEIVRNVDVVFHLAAQVSVARSIEEPVDSFETNLKPLLSILEAARGTDTRVVFASSAAIYGEPRYTPIDEDHPKAPTSPYGLEKLSADHYCRLYHELYGVETVALRYFNAYGPNQQAGDYAGVIGIFRDQALQDEPITVEGDGAQTRDFVHVGDIVQANIRAATENDAPGKAFNIGTGTATSIREVAERIREVLESESEIVHGDPRAGDIDESVADISRARSALGYEPRYDIHNGLDTYLSDYSG